MTTLHKFVVLLVCLGVLGGCGRTRPPHGPPMIQTLPPPSTESVPDQAEEGSGAPPDIQRMHVRLLEEAQAQFDAGEYTQAISGVKRVLALKPQDALEIESRWLLANAYNRIGEWEAARDHFRTLADSPSGHRYQTEAKLKYRELQRLLEKFTMPPLDTQAIRLSLEQLPASSGFDEGIKKMKEDGITSLLIDLGCQSEPFQSRPSGGIRHTDHHGGVRASHDLDLQSLLRSYIERSHRLDMLVYVGVNVRCAGYWHEASMPEWRDHTYNVRTRTTEVNRFFDIFHPDYQRFLHDFLARLSGENLDGLVFLDDYPLGVFDGVTPSGLRRFQQAFGTEFDPVHVFQPGFDPLNPPKSSRTSVTHSEALAEKPVFWRWAGWKARERLMVLERLIEHLRKDQSTVHVGLELHPHGLTDPVRALVEYAQDAMEATRGPFSFFFVRPEIDRRSAYDQPAAIEKLRRISTNAVLSRLLPVLDDPRRVWVSLPAEGGKRITPRAVTNGASLLQNFPAGIGVVHDLRAFS
jgi:hypothetical protein